MSDDRNRFSHNKFMIYMLIKKGNIIYKKKDNKLVPLVPTFLGQQYKRFEKYDKIFLPSFEIDMTKNPQRDRKIININFEELRRAGLYLIAIPAGKSKWFKGQQMIYRLCDSLHIPRRCVIRKVMPTNHKIEYDITNKQYRLVGSNTSPFGKSKWI